MLALLGLVAASGVMAEATRAWPAAIMIYGGGLREPFYITTRAIFDSETYLFLYGGAKKPLRADVTGRPYFDLAMFWSGAVWKAIDADPKTVRDLKPADATQRGRLYPPYRGEPAMVTATPFEAGSACSDEDPCGWTLGQTEVSVLRGLNIPGF